MKNTEMSWGINSPNKDGVVHTRPGYKTMFRLPDGEAQGMRAFTDSSGKTKIFTMVDGRTYVSEHPFDSYKEVTI